MELGPEMALTSVQTRDEEQERRYLARTVQLLTTELEHVTGSIDNSARSIQEQKELMWEQWRDMDHAEKANARTEVNLSVSLGEQAVLTRTRIQRLLNTPESARLAASPKPITAANSTDATATFRQPRPGSFDKLPTPPSGRRTTPQGGGTRPRVDRSDRDFDGRPLHPHSGNSTHTQE